MSRPDRPKSAPHYDPPSYGAAAIAAAAVLALYILTLAPTTAFWDASEYITAAHVLGIPHPPGNPFFVLVGKVFTLLPIAPGVAVRVNLLAAASSAVAAGVWFLVAERVLGVWLPMRWQRLVGAGTATLLGATAFTVWHQSVVNEKVYTVALLFFAVVAWLMVRWCDEPDGRRADRVLALVAYLLGLGYANHPAGLLVAPAVVAAVLARRPRTVLRPRIVVAGLGAFALGLSAFAFEPIRAAHAPAINMGEPTACEEGFGLSCTFSRTTLDRLMANIDREQYGKPSLLERQAPLGAQLGMWWLYFKWQWLRDAYGERPALQLALALVFFALGIGGGVVHWQRDRRSFWFFAPLVATVTIALVYYMNFRYGWSQAPELGGTVPREVRDRDYFYLWSFSTWSVWAGLGLVAVWAAVAQRIGGAPARDDRSLAGPVNRLSWMLAAPVLAIAAVPLIGNWEAASRAGETTARDWAHDLLQSLEPYAILITMGDNDTFPLWYAQEVEGVRRDVTIAQTSLLGTDWYARQLIRRPIYEYDPAAGPAVYRDRAWVRPTTPVMHLSTDEADRVPAYVRVEGPQRFVAGALEAIVDPSRLEYGVITRGELLTLQMIRDNVGVRPIYIPFNGDAYIEALGMGQYMLAQGLARKIVTDSSQLAAGGVPVDGEGFVDLARTRALWGEVYTGDDSIVRAGEWVDRASLHIPAAYAAAGLTYASALARTGAEQQALEVVEEVRALTRAARIEGWYFAPAERRGGD